MNRKNDMLPTLANGLAMLPMVPRAYKPTRDDWRTLLTLATLPRDPNYALDEPDAGLKDALYAAFVYGFQLGQGYERDGAPLE